MSYYEITPADAVKKLTGTFWTSPQAPLRALVRGVAASISANGRTKATVYLSRPSTEEVAKQLTALSAGVEVSFEYVGAFHFTGVGAKLRRREGYSGRMAAFVQGSDSRYYALTCGHVLQGEPSTRLENDVLIAGSHHPAKFAVKSVFDFNRNGENRIDGGLAELYPSAVPPRNHLPDGSHLPTDFATYSDGDNVTHAVDGGKQGKITSTVATLLVTAGVSELTVNDMIIAKSDDGLQFVKQGDSGSLFVKTADNRPLGILIAKAKSMLVGAGLTKPSDLAIICPIERTLDLLKDEPGAIGHYPGPYQLI